ncbi:hypothetical protein OG799_18380 [Micromonospora sp. NBC_00898]|uniref:hypothetical protein n=1 Tax=Micromonospora sp. NBC_00898 TaxID=2975981 RepID=UPI00386BEDCC|nr:hypothetical protein OG799_18380 [Micromonospora sp. NBC_00898]
MTPAMTSGVTTEPAILDALELTSDPELEARFAESARQILADLVSGGAAEGTGSPLPGGRENAERPHDRTRSERPFVITGTSLFRAAAPVR